MSVLLPPHIAGMCIVLDRLCDGRVESRNGSEEIASRCQGLLNFKIMT